MKIVLYGINYSPELTGIGKYTSELARWLADEGHQVSVVTAPPYYPEWQIVKEYKSWRWKSCIEHGVSVTRCPLFVPRSPTATKRLIHLFSFAASSALPLLYQAIKRPDIVVLIVPTMFCGASALLLAKLSGAQSIIHIQDYEVDALFGLGMSKSSVLRRIANTSERWLLSAFDIVSTISTGMLARAKQKGVNPDRLIFFPNWSEVSRFRNVSPSSELLRSLGVPDNKTVILYSGNIGEKQGLEHVIDAAVFLKNRKDIHFLLVGEGSGKQRLINLATKQKLENMSFAPLQPYEELPCLLASASVHLIVQKRGAADAVLPSKLTNILAVGGNSVITTERHTSLGKLCDSHPGIAVCVEPESVEALIYGIEQALALPRINSIAINYAAQYLDKDQILRRFIAEVSSGAAR